MKTTKSQNFGQDETRKKITQGGIHAVVSYHKKDVLSSEKSYAYDKPDMTIYYTDPKANVKVSLRPSILTD